jgi:serine/threonine-protein kinase
MGLGSVVRILSLLCNALEHAHQFTVHRDLSPDNVMVLQDGSIKLLDFGLAKLTNAQSALTMIGISLGKQEYMAPEQRASAAEVDKRADIYSLGVMFFEMLAGRLPKGGERISGERPDLPLECDAFVRKAMATDPDGRFRNAREFRHALNYVYRLSKGEAVQPDAMPTPTPEAATPAPPPHLLVPKPSLAARLLAPVRRFLARRRKRGQPVPPSQSG